MSTEETCTDCGFYLNRHILKGVDMYCPTGSKFVSVSLTPEARDALKAEAIKQMGETGVNLSMSDALLALIHSYRGEDSNSAWMDRLKERQTHIENRVEELENIIEQLSL